MTDRKPIIAIDGTESACGRALLCISALYFCADWLHALECRLIDVADDNVVLAAEALHWDLGLVVDVWQVERGRDASPLGNVSLYAGIATRSADHMRLDEAMRRHIPALLAVQFPDSEWLTPATVLRQNAAFDPQCFADDLGKVARQWIL